MSATNRGGERSEADFYPTPAWTVAPLLEVLDLPGGAWIEPGAGEGALVCAVNALRGDVDWTAVELHAERRGALQLAGAREVVIGDFVVKAAELAAAGRRFKVALGNPPFSLAQAFVELCLELTDYVVMLERLAWIGGSKGRRAAFNGRMPDLYDLGQVDFTGDGGDSSLYAWHVWGPGPARTRDHGRYFLLERPPAALRRPGALPAIPAGALAPRQADLFGGP